MLHTEKEVEQKNAIETLMNYRIPTHNIPEEVEISPQLIPEEKDKPIEQVELSDKIKVAESGASFHEKSAKNSKEKVKRKSYNEQLKERYKKPIRKGDKIQNNKKKKKKR